MANLSLPAPYEPSKQGDYLHDQSRIPPGPAYTRMATFQRYSIAILGILFAVGFVALAFQTRASWTTHRDWVVPVTVPFFSIGGVALAYLFVRGRWAEMLTGWIFLTFTILMTVFAIWRGAHVDGSDTFRDVLTVLAAIGLALTLIAFTIALVTVEAKDPVQPPAPEL